MKLLLLLLTVALVACVRANEIQVEPDYQFGPNQENNENVEVKHTRQIDYEYSEEYSESEDLSESDESDSEDNSLGVAAGARSNPYDRTFVLDE